MSLRARLLVLVVLATVVPAAFVGLRFVQNRAGEIETAFVNLAAVANSISSDLDEKIKGTAQLHFGLGRARDLDTRDKEACSKFLSNTPPYRECRDKEACSKFLSAVLEEYPQYTGILTIDPDGRLFCDSLRLNRILNLNDREYFRKAIVTQDVVTLEPVFGRLTGTSVLQIAYPVRAESGYLKFVLLASFNLQKFGEYHNERLSGGTDILFVDKKGTVLSWLSDKKQSERLGTSIAGTDLFQFAADKTGEHIGEVTGIDGRVQVWAVAKSPRGTDSGLYVMVGLSKGELVAAANRRLGEEMALLAVVSLLLFAGVWTLAEWGIRRPVGRLAAMATKLGLGDFSVRILPPYPGGELGGLMVVLNSTAESLERQHAAIDDLNKKLRQSQKMEALGQLTGGLAHDFNNLLTVILGNAEHLVEELSAEPELRSFAEGTVCAAARGAELTKNLLAFSRQQPLMPKDINVGQQILRMEVMLRRALGTHIKCKVILGHDLWPATADPAQLESAVLNLTLNARDATPEGGVLTVEIGNVSLDKTIAEHEEVEAGDYVMVAVTDTGTGMARDVANRAFEPFFTTKDVGKGSGLGLSMVYGFAKQSGGSVKIYSELGHGTVVKLYLPRARALKTIDEPIGVRKPVPRGSETILVVEDDDLVRSYVERELTELGYRVILAHDGSTALAILRQSEKIDLLFTDVVMPGGMLGPQLAEEALRLRSGLRILYTSGFSENAVIHNGRLSQDIQLLNKPFRRHELAEKLHSVLRQH